MVLKNKLNYEFANKSKVNLGKIKYKIRQLYESKILTYSLAFTFFNFQAILQHVGNTKRIVRANN